MKNIFIALFTLLTFSLNAQMSPPTVTRSGTSLTQQDSYLTVAKRLGIPTSATDDLDAAVTAQNSIKLLYNTTLQQLRLYNPVTMTWSSVGGDNIYTSDGVATEDREAEFPYGLTLKMYNSEIKLDPSVGGISLNTIGNPIILEALNQTVDISAEQINSLTALSLFGKSALGTGATINGSGNTLLGNGLILTGTNPLGVGLHLMGGSDNDDDIIINPFNGKVKILNLPEEEQTFIYGEDIDGKLVKAIPSSGGGGSSYFAKNGIYIDSDTIKLGGNITENTKLDNPNSKSIQIGSDGDAMNLNVPPPSEFGGLVSTYTGFDYRSPEYSSFIGVLKGLNFAPLEFSNQDMVGTFTITGNPFDSIFPDGSVMVDGLWYDEDGVAMRKIVITFLGEDIRFNQIEQYGSEQRESILWNNAIKTIDIYGENGLIVRKISNPTTSKKFTETITDTKQRIEVDNIELKSDVEIEGSLTNHDGSYYVKSTDLPKKLINFSGDVTTLVGAADPETKIFSYRITPDMWKTMSVYELSILGSFQAAATQNQTLSLYMNTTNSIGGSKLWNGYITTNTVASPFGGSVLAIEKKLWKDSNIIITEGGNTTVTTTNSNTNFDSGVYNNVLQKYLIESTLDFTNDIWLILTTDAGISSGTFKIKKLLLREI